MDFYDVLRLIARACGVLGGADANTSRKVEAAIDTHQAEYPATIPPSPEAVGLTPTPQVANVAPEDTGRLDALEKRFGRVEELLVRLVEGAPAAPAPAAPPAAAPPAAPAPAAAPPAVPGA
jgi:hypothetical protein